MIRSSPYGVSPNITVSINDVPINYNSLMSVVLDLREDQHDLCDITMSGVPSRSITDFIDQNVYVQINTGASFISEFYGTVLKSTPTADTSGGLVNGSLFQNVKFTCLGCSYSMRGANNRMWRNSTLEDVAIHLADTYGFSLDVPNDDLVFDTMVQAETDWQFLVRYADNMGYSVTVHGTHIHIFDPFKAKGRNISLHKLYAPARTSITPAPGQVVNFNGNFSRRAADGSYLDNVVAVLPDNGNTFNVRTSDLQGFNVPAKYDTRLNLTTDTYTAATRLLGSLYRNVYDYQATAVVLGAAGMVPGGMANLTGYSDVFDGLWYVAGVQHSVRSGSFITTADLRKNKIDTLVDISAAPFRKPAPGQQTNGVWESTKKVVNVY